MPLNRRHFRIWRIIQKEIRGLLPMHDFPFVELERLQRSWTGEPGTGIALIHLLHYLLLLVPQPEIRHAAHTVALRVLLCHLIVQTFLLIVIRQRRLTLGPLAIFTIARLVVQVVDYDLSDYF